jgi:deazaflavin-dependent oxidoreductase (nitroreductase family)
MAVGKVVVRVMSTLNTWAYRATGGRIGGKFLGGAPVMLLTTIGRKTGKPRTTPLLYMRDGENLICVASKGGMPHHPVWYRNLQANPEVETQIGTEFRRMRATTTTPEQKARYWPRLVALYPDFDNYQARTERDIPVIILSPR